MCPELMGVGVVWPELAQATFTPKPPSHLPRQIVTWVIILLAGIFAELHTLYRSSLASSCCILRW